MWTRYNIAESSVKKTMEKFDENWNRAGAAINRLPVDDLA